MNITYLLKTGLKTLSRIGKNPSVNVRKSIALERSASELKEKVK
jgi:hypothetical protein